MNFKGVNNIEELIKKAEDESGSKWEDFGLFVATDIMMNGKRPEVASWNTKWVYDITDSQNVKKMRHLHAGEIKLIKKQIDDDTISFQNNASVREENNKLIWEF
jgi:hypothetical protein